MSTFVEYTNWKGKELIEKISFYSEQHSHLMNLYLTLFHNLNTYTGNMKMLIDLIQTDDHCWDRDKNLMLLRTVSDDLEKTLADLSHIAHFGELNPKKETLKLRDFIARTENMINSYGNEVKATFVNNVPKNVSIGFNPAYLESVLLNLCTNAVKYSHPDRFPLIAFDWIGEENEKILTVSDNGLGIDLCKNKELLFGLYKTFHGNKESGGLGLYLTKYQIEAMQARVDVESEVDRGTTFKITFND